MLVTIDRVLLILAFVFTSTQGGSLSDEFVKSFSNEGDSKDTIVEFSPIIGQVLSHPSLTSLEGHERRTKIVGLMQEQTKATQLPVMNALTALGLGDKATPFWISNKIAIKDAPLGSLKALALIPGAFTVREAKTAKAFPVETGPVFHLGESRLDKRESTTYQWGVEKIGANIAIEKGISGKGVVVGMIDTGVRVTHEALKTNYRGGPYSWKDAINNDNTAPYDDNGHGTHCMGTIAGTTNGIGVAPGAQWIACKGLDKDGSGSELTLTTCGQFMACPNNSTGNCTDYPNVVSNSWGGGFDDDWFNGVIKSWTILDMVPCFAIGNSGPYCGLANSPGDQPNLISVGSIDKNGGVSEFSSRGPGGPLLFRWLSDQTKPEVVAPGRDIVSADNSSDTGYRALSGTSMAAPHVAGASALILSTNKTLGFEGVRERLEKTAVPKSANKICSICQKRQPNNQYGYGYVSVPKALNLSS